MEWHGKDSPDTKVVPLCAGFTGTPCVTNEECQGYFNSTIYTCEMRNWGNKKFCQTCGAAGGSPENCNPTKACKWNSDCASETTATVCAPIFASYCSCKDVAENVGLQESPYANPFFFAGFVSGCIIDPINPITGSFRSSIWCDKATDEYDTATHATCQSLYNQNIQTKHSNRTR